MGRKGKLRYMFWEGELQYLVEEGKGRLGKRQYWVLDGRGMERERWSKERTERKKLE